MVLTSAWATVTNWHGPGGLNNRYLFLRVWRLDVPRSRCCRFHATWEPPSWGSSKSLLAMSSHGGKNYHFSHVSSSKGTDSISEDSTLMTQSPPKDPTSKFHHIGNEGFDIGIQRGNRNVQSINRWKIIILWYVWAGLGRSPPPAAPRHHCTSSSQSHFFMLVGRDIFMLLNNQ